MRELFLLLLFIFLLFGSVYGGDRLSSEYEGGWQCINNKGTNIFLSVNVKEENDLFPYSVVVILFPVRHWEFSPVVFYPNGFDGKTYTYDPYKGGEVTEWGYINCENVMENILSCEIVGFQFPRDRYTCYRLIFH